MHVVGRKPKRYTARGQSDRQGTPPVGPDVAEQFSQFPVYPDGLQSRPGVFRSHPVKMSSTLANHLPYADPGRSGSPRRNPRIKDGGLLSNDTGLWG